MQRRHIIVAGGGIGGLFFAAAAARKGFEVTVLERLRYLDGLMKERPSSDAQVSGGLHVHGSVGGGLGLWPPSLEAARSIDALSELERYGSYMPNAGYRDKHGNLLAVPTEDFAARFPVLCLTREELLSVLYECCQRDGVQFVHGASIANYRFLEGTLGKVQVEYTVTPTGGSSTPDVTHLEADLLVGADGIHSNVRRRMLAKSAIGPKVIDPLHCGYAYFRANTDVRGISSDGSETAAAAPTATTLSMDDWHSVSGESWGDGQRFGYVPLGRPSVFWFVAVPLRSMQQQTNTTTATNPVPTNDALTLDKWLRPKPGAFRLREDEKQLLMELMQTWQGPEVVRSTKKDKKDDRKDGSNATQRINIQQLLAHTPADTILRTDIHKVPSVCSFKWSSDRGRVVLLGDACHATAPNLAQGAGLSIEDGWLLAELLGELQLKAVTTQGWEEGLQQAVERYERMRKPRAWTVQTLADSVAVVGQLSGPMAFFRDRMLRALMTVSPLLKSFVSTVFENVVSHSLGGTKSDWFWRCPTGLPGSEALPKLLGGTAEFEACPLPAAMKIAKTSRQRGLIGRGTGSVEVGTSLVAWLIKQWANLPPTMANIGFEGHADPVSGMWTRRFVPVPSPAHEPSYYCSTLQSIVTTDRTRSRYMLAESIGSGPFARMVQVLYDVSLQSTPGEDEKEQQKLCYRSKGLRIALFPALLNAAIASGKIRWYHQLLRYGLQPLMDTLTGAVSRYCHALLPTSHWDETPRGEDKETSQAQWAFEGELQLPRILGGGLLMRYSGTYTIPVMGNATEDAGNATDAKKSNKRSTNPQVRVIVAGGTGLIGDATVKALVRRAEGEEQHFAAGMVIERIIVLTRKHLTPHNSQAHNRNGTSVEYVRWDGKTATGWANLLQADQEEDQPVLSRIVFINLAGENPGAQRWHPQFKQRIQQSRLDSIAAYEGALKLATTSRRGKEGTSPIEHVLVQSSATGIYGDCGGEPVTSLTPSENNSFRIQCCKEVEARAAQVKEHYSSLMTTEKDGEKPSTASNPGLRVVVLRLGLVLSRDGGLLPYLHLASRCGLKAIGGGKQWLPWVHITDVANRIVSHAVTAPSSPNTEAPVDAQSVLVENVVAPNPAQQKHIFEYLSRCANHQGKSLVPLGLSGYAPFYIPQFVFSAGAGEASSVLLHSQRIGIATSSSSVPSSDGGDGGREGGFDYEYPCIESALDSWECRC